MHINNCHASFLSQLWLFDCEDDGDRLEKCGKWKSDVRSFEDVMKFLLSAASNNDGESGIDQFWQGVQKAWRL